MAEGIGVTFDSENTLGKFVRKLAGISRGADARVQQFRKDKGLELLNAVKAHASGRPGPNIVSGAYVSGFFITEGPEESRVTNLSAQTHRLEYGFYGVDSMGRNYHQPAFPHFRPALMEIREGYTTGILKAAMAGWRT